MQSKSQRHNQWGSKWETSFAISTFFLKSAIYIPLWLYVCVPTMWDQASWMDRFINTIMWKESHFRKNYGLKSFVLPHSPGIFEQPYYYYFFFNQVFLFALLCLLPPGLSPFPDALETSNVFSRIPPSPSLAHQDTLTLPMWPLLPDVLARRQAPYTLPFELPFSSVCPPVSPVQNKSGLKVYLPFLPSPTLLSFSFSPCRQR